MKKILSYVFLFCLTLVTFMFVSCKEDEPLATDLIATLLVEQESYVDADFYVVGEMKQGEAIYPITWTSNNDCLAVSAEKNEAGYYTITVTRPEDEAQTVELTATLTVSEENTATKKFEFRVYPIDVYDILDNFAFEHKGVKVEMGTSIDLPATTTYKEKTAAITWSTENSEVEIADGKATFATVVKDTAIKLKATLSYNNQEASMEYDLTISPYQTDFEKLKEWYENDGITQVLSGYVIEIATAYSESYGNISMYIINDDFTGGYYLYRVKMDANEASQLKIGSHVTATGTVNTNYSGLMETNAGGNVVVDEEIEAIDVASKVYAIDNDLIANVPSLYYRTSTHVSLSNWKVTEVAEKIDDGSSSATTILELEKDGVKTTIRYSNYVANTPMPNRNDKVESDVYKALTATLATISVGDYVNIKGLLSYYDYDKVRYNQESYQILVTGVDSITKIDNGSDVTDTDGKKMGAAIKEFEGFAAAYTSNTTITLPTTLGDATVTWAFHNKYHNGAELAENVLTITPAGYSVVSLDATLTVGNYTTKLYYSFVVEQLSDEEIADRVIEDVEIAEQFSSGDVELETTNELYTTATISYALKETTYKSVTLDGAVLKVNNIELTEDETITIIVTVKVGEVTKTREIEVVIHKLSVTSVADFIEAANEDIPALLEGVITAVNEPKENKASFVLTDAEGNSIFCYTGLDVELGDEVQILGYYGESYSFPQISNPVLYKEISTGKDAAAASGTAVELTAAAISEKLAEEGMTNEKSVDEYAVKYLAITGYVFAQSGQYVKLSSGADSDTEAVRVYANNALDLGSLMNTEITVYGFARGTNPSSGYITIQAQRVEFEENDEFKVNYELGQIEFESSYEAGEVTLVTTPTKYEGVVLSYAVKSGAENATIADGKLTLVASEQEVEVVITVTATLGEATKTRDITINVLGTAAVEPTDITENVTIANAQVLIPYTAITEAGLYSITIAEGKTITIEWTEYKDSSKYNEFGVYGGGYLKITATGVKLDTLISDVYGTYDNMKCYIGTDATGTLVTGTTGTDKGTTHTYKFETAAESVYFVNDSTHSVDFYDLTLVLEQTDITENVTISGSQILIPYTAITADGYYVINVAEGQKILIEWTEYKDSSKYNEFGVYGGGYLKITATGVKLDTLISDVYGTYDNMKCYIGTDATGTLVAGTTGTDSGTTHTYKFETAAESIYFVNDSTYSVDFYDLTLVLATEAEDDEEESDEITVSTHAQYIAAAVDTEITIKGIITKIKTSDNKQFWLVDADGAYQVYSSSAITADWLVVGNEVVLTGVKALNSKQHQIKTPVWVETVSTGNEVSATDITADVTANGFAVADEDQAQLVVIEAVVKSTSDKTLTVGEKTVAYYTYCSIPDFFVDGAKVKITAIKNVFNTASQLCIYSTDDIVDNSTDAEKAVIAINKVVSSISTDSYAQAAEITLDKVYSTATLTVTVQDGATTLVWDATTSKLTVTPTATAVSETVTITVTIGDATETETVTITSQISTSGLTATLAHTSTTTTNMDGTDQAALMGLDDTIFDVVGSKGSASNNVGLNKDGTTRLYNNAAGGSILTISIAEGYVINGIKITFGDKVGDFSINGTKYTKDTTEFDINGSSVAIQNVHSSNVQVHIKSIEITYSLVTE